jgi:hypothetical protein
MDHKKDLQWLVLEKLGKEAADDVDWSAPRLICIAGDFTRYDDHAVKQIERNIELIRYRRFGSDLLLLDLASATTAGGGTSDTKATWADESAGIINKYKTISTVRAELDEDMVDRFEALRRLHRECLGAFSSVASTVPSSWARAHDSDAPASKLGARGLPHW